MRSTVDSMVGNAYLYGREWLSTKVVSLSLCPSLNCSIVCLFICNKKNTVIILESRSMGTPRVMTISNELYVPVT